MTFVFVKLKPFAGILSAIFVFLTTATTAAPLRSALPYSENLPKVEELAKKAGVPMAAFHRALKEAENPIYNGKDAFAVFDLSQPSRNRRFYLIDLRAGAVSAYHSSHGKGNGSSERATQFKNFNRVGSNMTPLGAMKALEAFANSYYEEVRDEVNKKTYKDLLTLDMMGVKAYNSKFIDGQIWVIGHSRWYATDGYRRTHNGTMGRSLGCIVLDPTISNEVFLRLAGGSLIYITVGNDPIEKYLQGKSDRLRFFDHVTVVAILESLEQVHTDGYRSPNSCQVCGQSRPNLEVYDLNRTTGIRDFNLVDKTGRKAPTRFICRMTSAQG